VQEEMEQHTILIVDDSPENITVLGSLLRPDYKVRVATSGEKALKIAKSDAPPDLILLDVMMPGMDGYQVCEKIKSDQRTKNIPIIFITAKNNEADEVKGFTFGAVDYVAKPFSPIVIQARVRTHLELKKYRDFLENTSYCDGLTTIANRRRFDEYLGSTWCMSVRESLPLSLIMIDIDNFKQFNDHYGHQEGDTCLIRIAEALSASLRRKTDLIARYGGEEFVCVLPNTGTEGVAITAENIRSNILSLRIPHLHSTPTGCVTVSQGLASIRPVCDVSSDTLITAADEALYEAKESGRNRICSRRVRILNGSCCTYERVK
jgi:diguanylate cyclase (GGDEF)-like protein